MGGCVFPDPPAHLHIGNEGIDPGRPEINASTSDALSSGGVARILCLFALPSLFELLSLFE